MGGRRTGHWRLLLLLLLLLLCLWRLLLLRLLPLLLLCLWRLLLLRLLRLLGLLQRRRLHQPARAGRLPQPVERPHSVGDGEGVAEVRVQPGAALGPPRRPKLPPPGPAHADAPGLLGHLQRGNKGEAPAAARSARRAQRGAAGPHRLLRRAGRCASPARCPFPSLGEEGDDGGPKCKQRQAQGTGAGREQ